MEDSVRSLPLGIPEQIRLTLNEESGSSRMHHRQTQRGKHYTLGHTQNAGCRHYVVDANASLRLRQMNTDFAKIHMNTDNAYEVMIPVSMMGQQVSCSQSISSVRQFGLILG